ncbi:hypothetical protein BCU69_20880 [Vibrio cyclitrophicus]|uniref:hypothetical protein n=1 Tax=Vibrio TaxID=662 RepID=UPI0004F39DE8|nr:MULTISPECIES: hypothetical protein [Vibrio]ATI48546.1 hypothetical protein CO725_24300 [Vibrio parahaemolyticus]PMH37936.1 hypothetical protein BCU69_20880 [Vibrio cyclitrophicus]
MYASVKYNQLIIENENISMAIEGLENQNILKEYIIRFVTEEIELIEISDSENEFAFISSKNLNQAEQEGHKSLNKDIFLLLCLTRFLDKDQIYFANQVCKKIKTKSHRMIGAKLIDNMERFYFLESAERNGVKAI